MTNYLRLPVVWFAFLVEQLRRVPGVRWVERHGFWISAGLLLVGAVTLLLWASQKSPQRVTMAQLTAGNLAPLQTWIIISGDLRSEPSAASFHRYSLTDPGVADAVINITSDFELATGPTTVSGNIQGGSTRAHEGFLWSAQLQADPILAREPDPPWLSIGLAALAAFIVIGGRSAYPAFFRQAPESLRPSSGTLPVGVRRGWPPEGAVSTGNLVVVPGLPVELRMSAQQPQRLRLHSAHSSADVGELRGLSTSEPVVVIRPSSGELTLSFASTRDRDSVYAALLADLDNPAPLQPQPGVASD